MTDLDGSYVRMLEHWLEIYGPDHWPVTVVRPTLAEIRRAGQYGGENPRAVPTSGYVAELVESSPLLNASTGEFEPGAIYRLERVSDG